MTGRDVLVVGAGVVGLAIARTLAMRGHAVIIAEATGHIGSGISSRSSEVIHAGLYYPTDSLRARHCVAGNRLLYAFAAQHDISHARCGKLIVASTDQEVAAIHSIHAQGCTNGVEGLSLLSTREVAALEPLLACRAALLSATTGIIDSHAFMHALQGDLEAAGGMVAFNTSVDRLWCAGARWRVHFGGVAGGQVSVDAVINAAGLEAQALAARTDGYPAERVPPRVLAKGNYFTHAARNPFRHLIYPAPIEGGLGIHATMDLAGRLRFGPDVEWVDTVSYNVDPHRAAAFGQAIRRYWPSLRDADLHPDYAGVRPKLSGPGQPPADFRIDGRREHGLPGLVHLFGIESPGLTAALSLAEAVADEIED